MLPDDGQRSGSVTWSPGTLAKWRMLRVTSGAFASRQMPACIASRMSIPIPAARSSRSTVPARTAAPRVSVKHGAASSSSAEAGLRA